MIDDDAQTIIVLAVGFIALFLILFFIFAPEIDARDAFCEEMGYTDVVDSEAANRITYIECCKTVYSEGSRELNDVCDWFEYKRWDI